LLQKNDAQSFFFPMIDETGMDSSEVYPYGWAPKGQRCEAKKRGNRGTRQRINLVAGLKQGTLLAPVIFNGYCDGRFFIEWMKQELIPSLQPGDTVILDNAPFHPKDTIIAMLKEAKCHALFSCAALRVCRDTHHRITK
jgi:DDE superfamily endonuclease